MRERRSAPRPFAATLVAAACLAVPGCASESASAPSPCAATLGSDPAYDLVLDETGACAGAVKMSLRVATGDPAAPVWSASTSAPLRVEGAWTLADGAALRSVRVTNPGGAAVALVGLEWSATNAAPRADRFLHAGYQSWSYSGIEAIPDAHADQLGTAPHGGDGEDVLAELPGVSWSYAALSDAGGDGLTVGADGATVFKTYVAAETSRLRIVQGVTGDALTLAPGESVALDGLFVGVGRVAERLDAYAARVAALHRPPPPAARRAPLAGWGSWNLYYDKPTAALLREQMAFASQRLAPAGLKDFLLDDGYEPHWGAWSAKSDFGAELSALNAEQATMGLAPALWLAPFYVDVGDAAALQHPEWFVRKRGATDGSLRTFSNLGGGTYAALDVTQPDARAFVVAQLQRLRDWGYRTLKLDFLFGGAVEGVRSQPITALQSYALWMKTIRDAVPELHLVGCGAPLLASVGWVDSMRTGADIAYSVAPEPTFSFVTSEARSTAMRAFTDAWWAIDPDVLLLRGAKLDDVEAWTAVVSSALSGGNYLLGDPREAGELRAAMALDPSILALAHDGVAARPRDLTSGVDPSLYPSPLLLGGGETAVPHVWEKSRWVAVFGWQSDPSFAIDLELPAGSAEIVPPAAPGPASLVPREGDLHVEVAGHATRLFRLGR